MIRLSLRLIRLPPRSPNSSLAQPFANSKSESPGHPLTEQEESALVEQQGAELMEDKFEKVRMPGLEDRHLTGLDARQSQILAQGSFDLMDPLIRPETARLSTSLGIDPQHHLTEVSLGRVKVKKENEVFLSEVDPYNIPDYYEIVFDRHKEMTVVGRQMEEGDQEGSQMSIASQRSFQERSQQEISREVLGLSLNPLANSRVMWKQFVFAVLFCYLVSQPLLATYTEHTLCLDSINQIEAERMKQISLIKRQALGQALLNNPQFAMI